VHSLLAAGGTPETSRQFEPLREERAMADKPQLVIAYFESEEVADGAARRLVTWARADPLARLAAAGVFVKDEHEQVETHKLGPREARRGAAVGLVLGGLAALVSGGVTLLQGVIVGGAGGGALGSLFHKGLGTTGDDVERIGSRLDGGRAAVGVLVPERQAPAVAEKLQELGGELESPEVTPAPADLQAETVPSAG
jgi:uncharacterized membrane protein